MFYHGIVHGTISGRATSASAAGVPDASRARRTQTAHAARVRVLDFRRLPKGIRRRRRLETCHNVFRQRAPAAVARAADRRPRQREMSDCWSLASTCLAELLAGAPPFQGSRARHVSPPDRDGGRRCRPLRTARRDLVRARPSGCWRAIRRRGSCGRRRGRATRCGGGAGGRPGRTRAAGLRTPPCVRTLDVNPTRRTAAGIGQRTNQPGSGARRASRCRRYLRAVPPAAGAVHLRPRACRHGNGSHTGGETRGRRDRRRSSVALPPAIPPPGVAESAADFAPSGQPGRPWPAARAGAEHSARRAPSLKGERGRAGALAVRARFAGARRLWFVIWGTTGRSGARCACGAESDLARTPGPRGRA